MMSRNALRIVPGNAVHHCNNCGQDITAEEWKALPLVGYSKIPADPEDCNMGCAFLGDSLPVVNEQGGHVVGCDARGYELEMRNHACGSTLAQRRTP